MDMQLERLLATLGIAGGYRRLTTCDSTNHVLKQLAHDMMMRESQQNNARAKPSSHQKNCGEWDGPLSVPKDLPFVLVADEQTAGRGRQSNTWWTGQGALALSMLLDANQHGLKPQTAAQLSLGMGYAVLQALQAMTEVTLIQSKNATLIDDHDASVARPNIEIRWPNDVYVNDRKISGILIEVPNTRHFVIGIGVNTNSSAADAPEEIRDRVATLRDVLGQNIDQDLMVYLLCRAMMTVLSFFPSDLPELIQMVEKDLFQVGKMVNIVRESESIAGKCLGLNSDGSLRVLTETGEKAVISGVAL